MNTKIIFNDQPAIRRKLYKDLLQQLNMTSTISTWAHQNGGLSSGRFKSTVCPQLTSTAIIWFKGCSIRSHDPFFTWIGLDCDGSQLIHTKDTCAWNMGQVSCDDAPLFSTNCGSCFSASWNQLSWRFHSNPSASNHSQMVESERWMPCRS